MVVKRAIYLSQMVGNMTTDTWSLRKYTETDKVAGLVLEHKGG